MRDINELRRVYPDIPESSINKLINMFKEMGYKLLIEQFIEGLYKNIVEGNMKLYKQFFLYDPNEEGTIEYWKNAIAFYDKLDDKDKEILFSIIKSTIVDTVSNVLAVLDGHEDIDRINVQVKLNGQENDSELQDAFLAYVEDLDE